MSCSVQELKLCTQEISLCVNLPWVQQIIVLKTTPKCSSNIELCCPPAPSERFVLELSYNQLALKAKGHASTIDGKQIYTALACKQFCFHSGTLLMGT